MSTSQEKNGAREGMFGIEGIIGIVKESGRG